MTNQTTFEYVIRNKLNLNLNIPNNYFNKNNKHYNVEYIIENYTNKKISRYNKGYINNIKEIFGNYLVLAFFPFNNNKNKYKILEYNQTYNKYLHTSYYTNLNNNLNCNNYYKIGVNFIPNICFENEVVISL